MSRGSSGYSFPVGSPDPIPGVAQVLFVCHANQCRSPFAEAIARRLLGDAPVMVTSAGLIAGGRPMPSTGRTVAEEFGLDFGHHRSRELDLHDFGGYDLVLTMAREQARELVTADPDAWPRIFTLKQFSRWVVENPRPPRSALGSWLDSAASGRSRTSILGSSNEDDVADPIGRPADVWRRMAGDLKEHLVPVTDALTRA